MANVLIVDDERSIRSSLSALLKDAGHVVLAAESVDEALRRLEAWSADVVLCDLVMPGRGGLDLLQEVRSRWPRVQVIMMTGQPTFDSAGVAVRGRAFDYLIKPISKERLLDVVAQAAAAKVGEDEHVRSDNENQKARDDLERLADRSTAALQLGQNRYKAALHTCADGFLRTDEQGRLLEVNSAFCQMIGYSEQELLAMCTSDLEPVGGSGGDFTRMQATLEPGEHCLEGRYRRKDGSDFPVEVHTQCKLSAGGYVIAFVRDRGTRTSSCGTVKSFRASMRSYESRESVDDDGRPSFALRATAGRLRTDYDPSSLRYAVTRENFPNPPATDVSRICQ